MADPSRTASVGDGLDGLKRVGLPASAHQRPGPGEGPTAREADAGQTRQQLEGAGTRQRDEHDQEVEGTDGQDVADGEEQHDAQPSHL